jgi:curli production assembly/transport component CsgF
MNKLTLPLLLLLLVCGNFATGQDFVYKPVNPAFGGDTFNYNWLLSSAQEQNLYESKNAANPFGSGLDNFEENFNRQILNLLSRQLVVSAFGDNGLENGLYTIGSYEIEVTSNTSGINIYILNTSDGSETTVVVPYY